MTDTSDTRGAGSGFNCTEHPHFQIGGKTFHGAGEYGSNNGDRNPKELLSLLFAPKIENPYDEKWAQSARQEKRTLIINADPRFSKILRPNYPLIDVKNLFDVVRESRITIIWFLRFYHTETVHFALGDRSWGGKLRWGWGNNLLEP